MAIIPLVILGALLAALGLGPAPDVVRWDAPGSCPSQTEVSDAVSRYVGRPLGAESVRAVGQVTEGDGVFRLELRLEDDGGGVDQRTLEHSDCTVITDVAALMVAVAIDPEAATAAALAAGEGTSGLAGTEISGGSGGSRTGDEDGAAQGESPPERSDETEASAEGAAGEDSAGADGEEGDGGPETGRDRGAAGAETGRRRDRELRSCRPGPSALRGSPRRFGPACVSLRGRLSLQLGPLPRFGPGGGIDVSLLWPRLVLELGATHYFEQPARLDSDDTLGGDVRLTVGHARACARLRGGPFEFPLCGGVEAGVMRGVGVGVDVSQSDRLPWAAGLVDAGAVVAPIRRLALLARVGAVVPFASYRFRVDGLETVHRPAPVGLRIGLGVAVRLP